MNESQRSFGKQPEPAFSRDQSDRGLACVVQAEPTMTTEGTGVPVTVFPAECVIARQKFPLTIRCQDNVAVFTKWNVVIGETVRVIGNRYGNVLDAMRIIRKPQPRWQDEEWVRDGQRP